MTFNLKTSNEVKKWCDSVLCPLQIIIRNNKIEVRHTSLFLTIKIMYNEEKSDQRMKAIGQNGNTGKHYKGKDGKLILQEEGYVLEIKKNKSKNK